MLLFSQYPIFYVSSPEEDRIRSQSGKTRSKVAENKTLSQKGKTRSEVSGGSQNRKSVGEEKT